MDIGRAVRAPYARPGWAATVALGGLWVTLGVTVPALTGWGLEYLRRVARGDDELPTWDGFGNLWVEGALVMVATFIYLLPAFVLLGFSMVPALIGFFGEAAAAGATESGAMGLLALVGTGGSCLMTTIAIVYMVAVSVLLEAAVTNYAMTRTFGSFFAFKDILARIKSANGYFTAWIMFLLITWGYSFAAGTIASIATSVTFGLGAVAAGFIGGCAATLSLATSRNLFGQWAAVAYGQAAAPSPVPPV